MAVAAGIFVFRCPPRARERRHRDRQRLSRTSPHLAGQLGIFLGYVVGKAVGILGSTWLLTRLSRGRLRPPVGWAAVAEGGTIAGIGFTVSLLVATLDFAGSQLEEARLGILSAALGASILTWLLFRATALLPRRLRIRALLGTAEPLVDLYIDVGLERNHIRAPTRRRSRWWSPATSSAPLRTSGAGPARAPACVRRCSLRLAAPAAQRRPCAYAACGRDLRGGSRAGAFWEVHDLLLAHQDSLESSDRPRSAPS